MVCLLLFVLNVSSHLWCADDTRSLPLVVTSSTRHLSQAPPHVWKELSETAAKQLSSHFRSTFFPVMPYRNLDKLIVCQGRSFSCWLIVLVFPGCMGASDVFCFKQGCFWVPCLSRALPCDLRDTIINSASFWVQIRNYLKLVLLCLSPFSLCPNLCAVLFISVS